MRVSSAGSTQFFRLRIAKAAELSETAYGTQEHLQPFGKDCSYGFEILYRILRQVSSGTS